MTAENLNNSRAEIDEIDRQILELLNRRASVALRVGAVKAERNAALCDRGRENEVIKNVLSLNSGPFDDRGLRNIFRRIIDESLYLQQTVLGSDDDDGENRREKLLTANGELSIGYLGEKGTFSEAAAFALFNYKARYISFPTFESLFDSVGRGLADHAIVPLENTLVGSLHQCYDLLLASGLTIAAEVVLPISHFLIGVAGSSIDLIKTVESHPAALGQCRRFFAAHPNAAAVAGSDTAGCVKRAAASGDPTRAAIGSRRAAAIYGGTILREHIEDHAENFTRFVLLANDVDNAEYAAGKISLVLKLASEPGSLHRALRPFVRRQIDLTKIESRPIYGEPKNFNFYIDAAAPPYGQDLDGALEELAETSAEMRFLGRYPSFKLTEDELTAIENQQ